MREPADLVAVARYEGTAAGPPRPRSRSWSTTRCSTRASAGPCSPGSSRWPGDRADRAGGRRPRRQRADAAPAARAPVCPPRRARPRRPDRHRRSHRPDACPAAAIAGPDPPRGGPAGSAERPGPVTGYPGRPDHQPSRGTMPRRRPRRRRNPRSTLRREPSLPSLKSLATEVLPTSSRWPRSSRSGPSGRRPPCRRCPAAARAEGGRWLRDQRTTGLGGRSYDVYLPAGLRRRSRVPMVLLLHGCHADPAEFADATRFTTVADRHGFILVLPRQERQHHCSAAGAGTSRCTSSAAAASRRCWPRSPGRSPAEDVALAGRPAADLRRRAVRGRRDGADHGHHLPGPVRGGRRALGDRLPLGHPRPPALRGDGRPRPGAAARPGRRGDRPDCWSSRAPPTGGAAR